MNNVLSPQTGPDAESEKRALSRAAQSGLVAFAIGSLFALGLALSGMTDPKNVKSFLDVTGPWDPTLAFVMGGAIAVHFVGRRLVRRPAPLFRAQFEAPPPTRVTARLVVGSALFGVGWGLSGICPGPALANLTSGSIVFVGTMLAGMFLQRLSTRVSFREAAKFTDHGETRRSSRDG